MRKYLYLAVAAASATVMVAPLVAQAAPAVRPHVLTIKKPGGTAVKVGAKLGAGLVKGSTAVFTIKSGSSTLTITCKSSSFTAVVVKNPLAKGTATESQTAESISKCTLKPPIATIKSVTAVNLPYNATVSDSKGFPVTVSGRTKAKPIELTATAAVGAGKIVCTFKAASVTGSASNKGSTITITKQKFTKVNASCPISGPAFFSAKYGPVVDTSVTGKPAVFVN